MSKQASKSLIGAFVIGAIALAVIGILIFGSGDFFSEKSQYVLYFKGSVKGLNIGAPVVFRGVKIGTVTDIELQFNTADLSARIPVTIELDHEKFRTVSDVVVKKYQYLKPLIDRGLRAQLTMQSIVTGQLMINFDFFPETTVELTGLESGDPEIPTISSGFDELLETIEQLPLQVLFDKLVSSIEGIETLVKAPETRESISNLNETLKSAKKTLDDLDMEIEPFMTNIEETSDAARAAFVQAEKTLAMEEGVPGDLASSLKKTLETASNALEKTEKTIASIQESVAEDSALSYEMSTMLKDLSAAARSIRVLADYFERHPEALLKGKGAGIRR
jgi:paraquat-inducible protein B